LPPRKLNGWNNDGNGETEIPQGPSVFEKSKEAYFKLIHSYQDISIKLQNDNEVDCDSLRESIEEIIVLLREDERMLLGMANTPYSYALRHSKVRPYVAVVVHGVNIAIYSLKLLLDLAVPENRLAYLGLAALFSHVGMLGSSVDFLESEPSESKADMVVENDPEKFISKIRIKNFHTESIKSLISIIKQEQLFLGATTLTEAVHQYAMVIHICDEFEKLTHQRAYGELASPIDAMKILRDKMKNYFNKDIIKFFFNKLSIYPIGSYVQLSSKETAKIVGINENFIMRPIVLIVLDAEGREKIEPVRVNLREKPTLYIKKAVQNEALYEKFIMKF
jgi:hypothetical protein